MAWSGPAVEGNEVSTMANPPTADFAGLLRRLRTDAGLTQERLAERASLSPRSISDLERGVNLTARQQTARLLADALGLSGAARAAFEAVARGRPTGAGSSGQGTSSGGVAGATRTLPRDIASFTGRTSELRQLEDAVAGAAPSGGVVEIYAIGGMAGIGKTAFAVHAAHLLAPRFSDGQIFLPLHGHTPGQQPVAPADALASLLQTVGIAAQQIPTGLEARTLLWRDRLAGRRLLLLLDDAAGHQQIRPLLPGAAGNLVLVTSRRHLTALEETRTISLDTLLSDEAAALLIALAARPDLRSGDAAVGEITRLCGCLPLAVGMLARQLHHHPSWTTAGLAADLAAARDRLELMAAENLSVAAAFDLSYQDLTPGQQRLFRRLGLHPGIDLDAYAAAALDGGGVAAARHGLKGLYDHYLLAESTPGRYSLHDLIREHARTLAATDPHVKRDSVIGRLLDYYLHMARTADRHLARLLADPPAVTTVPPASAPDLPTRQEAVAWMDAERLNLHAAADYAATHGRPSHATAIPTAMHGYLRSQGHWSQALTLHHVALQAARHAADQGAEVGALTHLGHVEYLTGDYPAATDSLTRALAMSRELGDRVREANSLGLLGVVQRRTADNAAATASLTQALDLFRGLGDGLGEANALRELGTVQQATGDPGALVSYTRSLELSRGVNDPVGEADALDCLGAAECATGNYAAAAAMLTLALELHRSVGNRQGLARALARLARVRLATADYPAAAAELARALELYRSLADRSGEAGALGLLGCVQLRAGNLPPAAASLTHAVKLYRELGDREGQATVLNNMGELSLASAEPADARARHEQALAIAVSIAALLEQARALEGIGLCQIQEGQPSQGAARLRESLTIYERIGSPVASHVEALLRDRGQGGASTAHPTTSS
jgi:tetratricopeptide (TPR) repeat protein/transcriptional regulator with XRE-family HTH domain